MLRYMLATLLVVLLPGAALGSGFPLPQHERYTDQDRQARILVPGLQDDAVFNDLRRLASRGRTTAEGLSALAYAYALRGDSEASRSSLEQALEHAGKRKKARRHVLWSAGWTYLHLGDYPAAAQAWTESAELHGGRPQWLPYSMAVLAELDGRAEEAFAWYEAATRSQARWSRADEVERSTRHWNATERQALQRLFLAWQARKTPTLEVERSEAGS